MSTKEQPKENHEQSTAVEYSYKTDIEIIIRSVTKETYQDILFALTSDKEASKICAMSLGITQAESITEQKEIKPTYENVRKRLIKGKNSEETIQICTNIMEQHLRSAAWNNLIEKRAETQNFEIPEEELDGDFVLDSKKQKPKQKLPAPTFEQIQKMTEPKGEK